MTSQLINATSKLTAKPALLQISRSKSVPSLCRDCFHRLDVPDPPRRCPACRGHRLVSHPELFDLTMAHLDCDAFYATVEKRDDPSLRDKPVIVGGGKRGVVSTACYVARLYGVRSAMPAFKALQLCPDAVVLKPDMAKYKTVGLQVRDLMFGLTPLVEPLSIDEAFMDLSGTQKLHGGSPAETLARLAKKIEEDIRITVSIGLSYNKFLAKVASDLDKPQGFAVIGREEAEEFLAEQPVSLLWGVGKSLQKTLLSDGIRLIKDLKRFEENELLLRYGAIGRRLYAFSRGQDSRHVQVSSPTKSISSETTFNDDIGDLETLKRKLWYLSEKVSTRLKKADLSGHTVQLKLKTDDFKQLSRSHRLTDPTQLAELIYQEGCRLLEPEVDGRAFRLIGIGLSDLKAGKLADPPDLLDPRRDKRKKIEEAMDKVRNKLGSDVIKKGRSL
ncbi:DNA polymerase IV [Rhodovibrionaceae bacterium A322]